MSSTPPHQSIAATAHFVEAERLLAALPLVTKRGERDRQLGLALVNAVLAIAATMLNDWQTITQPEEDR
jgi:hypothetical protein